MDDLVKTARRAKGSDLLPRFKDTPAPPSKNRRRVMDDLTKHEIEVLRVANGEDVPGQSWGAAMSACLGFLKARGLVQQVSGVYQITEAGRAALAEQAKDDE